MQRTEDHGWYVSDARTLRLSRLFTEAGVDIQPRTSRRRKITIRITGLIKIVLRKTTLALAMFVNSDWSVNCVIFSRFGGSKIASGILSRHPLACVMRGCSCSPDLRQINTIISRDVYSQHCFISSRSTVIVPAVNVVS